MLVDIGALEPLVSCLKKAAMHTTRAFAMLALSLIAKVQTLQHTATRCNTLQHAATRCNTLQHTATHCVVALSLIAKV